MTRHPALLEIECMLGGGVNSVFLVALVSDFVFDPMSS
jgi:hypothetical protein